MELQKNYKTAIGMMSGTSVDGIDAVLVKIDSDFNFEIIDTHTLDYPKQIRENILAIANNNAATKDICNMDFVIGH